MKSYLFGNWPSGIINVEDVFTETGETYSGSEKDKEYYFSIISKQILQHKFPIIIDSFREGELSSSKNSQC
jgi:hypothetical protein